MAEAGLFPNARIGGFDKKSVISYIDSLNEGFHHTEQEYKRKLEEYAKAQESQLAHIKRLEETLAEQSPKLEAVANRLEEERELAKQAQQMIAQLDAQNQQLQKQHADDQRELQIQLERARQLQFKLESLDYKSKKYDELSNQIGDTIIEAKQNAKQILTAAESKAQEIVRHAQNEMNRFYGELSHFKSDSGRLRKSIEEILFVLNDRVDVMQEVIGKMESHAKPHAPLDYTEDKDIFTANADQAGYFGGLADEHLPD